MDPVDSEKEWQDWRWMRVNCYFTLRENPPGVPHEEGKKRGLHHAAGNIEEELKFGEHFRREEALLNVNSTQKTRTL